MENSLYTTETQLDSAILHFSKLNILQSCSLAPVIIKQKRYDLVL